MEVIWHNLLEWGRSTAAARVLNRHAAQATGTNRQHEAGGTESRRVRKGEGKGKGSKAAGRLRRHLEGIKEGMKGQSGLVGLDERAKVLESGGGRRVQTGHVP